MSRVLVIGATGLLGPWVVERARAIGEVVTAARSGADLALDLRDAAAVARAVTAVRPSVVVHLAGITDVDWCEGHPLDAQAVNGDGASWLAAATPPGATLVFVSTDQVYADVAGPHAESATGPINAYGRSKLVGERAVLEHARPLVVRTNFFGPSRTPDRASLSDWVVAELGAGRDLPLFTDVLFSPLHLVTVAELLFELVDREARGVFNLGGRDGMSKHDFGLAVAAHHGLDTGPARPVRSTTVAGRAPRTADLRMAVSRLEAALGRIMPTVAEEIEKL